VFDHGDLSAAGEAR